MSFSATASVKPEVFPLLQRLAAPRSKWETPADQIIERAGSAQDSPRKVRSVLTPAPQELRHPVSSLWVHILHTVETPCPGRSFCHSCQT